MTMRRLIRTTTSIDPSERPSAADVAPELRAVATAVRDMKKRDGKKSPAAEVEQQATSSDDTSPDEDTVGALLSANLMSLSNSGNSTVPLGTEALDGDDGDVAGVVLMEPSASLIAAPGSAVGSLLQGGGDSAAPPPERGGESAASPPAGGTDGRGVVGEAEAGGGGGGEVEPGAHDEVEARRGGSQDEDEDGWNWGWEYAGHQDGDETAGRGAAVGFGCPRRRRWRWWRW